MKRTHELEDLGKILQRSSLEGGLDQSALEEVQSFDAILTVADIAALDADHANNSVQNRRFEEGICRKTNGHNGSARADILCCLLEWLL